MSVLRIVMCIAIVALDLGARPAAAFAQAAADTVPLAKDAEVRAKVAALGPDWQHGRVVRITIGAGECLGFAPTPPSPIGALTLNATDSLEVAVADVPRDTARVVAKWIGISQARLQLLSRGCERPRP